MSPVADLVFVWKLLVSSAVIHVPGGLAMVGHGVLKSLARSSGARAQASHV
jgi:hypothetical protein